MSRAASPQSNPVLGIYSESDAVRALEVALAELLQTLFRLRKERTDEIIADCVRPERRVISATELLSDASISTPIDNLVGELNQIGGMQTFVLHGIHRIGSALFDIGAVELMQSVAERVSDEPLVCYGHTERGSDFQKQMSVLDSRWNGIGGQWWA